MSVIIAKIKEENNISTVKRILAVFSKEVIVMKDEEYRDAKFTALLAEGRKSRILSEKETKKELKKRGIAV